MGKSSNIMMRTVFDIVATSIDGDDTNVDYTYKAIKVFDSKNGINYDSERGNLGSPMGEMYNLKGTKFTILMGKKGEIKEVKALDSTDPNMKNNLGQGIAILPDHPVAMGDSWTQDVTVNSNGMNLLIQRTLTLESVNNGIAHINQQATIAEGTSEMNGYKLKWSGTNLGFFDVEIATGVTMKSKTVQKVIMFIDAVEVKYEHTFVIETK